MFKIKCKMDLKEESVEDVINQSMGKSFKHWEDHGIQSILFVEIAAMNWVPPASSNKKESLIVKIVIKICSVLVVLLVINLSLKESSLHWVRNGILSILYVPPVILLLVVDPSMREVDILIAKNITITLILHPNALLANKPFKVIV